MSFQYKAMKTLVYRFVTRLGKGLGDFSRTFVPTAPTQRSKLYTMRARILDPSDLTRITDEHHE